MSRPGRWELWGNWKSDTFIFQHTSLFLSLHARARAQHRHPRPMDRARGGGQADLKEFQTGILPAPHHWEFLPPPTEDHSSWASSLLMVRSLDSHNQLLYIFNNQTSLYLPVSRNYGVAETTWALQFDRTRFESQLYQLQLRKLRKVPSPSWTSVSSLRTGFRTATAHRVVVKNNCVSVGRMLSTPLP